MRKSFSFVSLLGATLVLGGGCTTASQADYVENEGTQSQNAIVSGSTHALAIVTTNALLNNSSSLLNAYAAFKRLSQPTYVVTEDKTYLRNGVVENNGWGQGVDLTQPPCLDSSSDRADGIRSWLKSHHVALGIESVFLVGDPNPSGGTLPMKNFYPYKDYAQAAQVNPALWDKVKWTCSAPSTATKFSECTQWVNLRDEGFVLPTDYYYSNLTYDWPLDNDGDIVRLIGTYYDHQDVHVGRLPVTNNDVTAMNKTLSKFITYSTSPDVAWRKNALLAMGHQGEPGDFVPFAETLRTQMLIPNGYSAYRIYEPYKPNGCTTSSCVISGDLPLSITNMGSVWAGGTWPDCQGTVCKSGKQNFGVVIWGAHGLPRSAADVIDMDSSNDYSKYLDDSHPAYVASDSCENGNPHTPNNIAASLLTQGAVGMLAATRISWPGDWDKFPPYTENAASTDVVYGFFQELIANQRLAGAALSQVRTFLWQHGLSKKAIPDRTTNPDTFQAWDMLTWWYAQPLLFNLYGDPTMGIDHSASSDPDVKTLPSDTPTNVTLTPNATQTMFADNWPSKGNPWWTANVVLSVNSLSGQPIPAGTVWVNGTAYSIGGTYYQVVDIPDQGPYTIQVTTSTSATLQIQLGNR